MPLADACAPKPRRVGGCAQSSWTPVRARVSRGDHRTIPRGPDVAAVLALAGPTEDRPEEAGDAERGRVRRPRASPPSVVVEIGLLSRGHRPIWPGSVTRRPGGPRRRWHQQRRARSDRSELHSVRGRDRAPPPTASGDGRGRGPRARAGAASATVGARRSGRAGWTSWSVVAVAYCTY